MKIVQKYWVKTLLILIFLLIVNAGIIYILKQSNIFQDPLFYIFKHTIMFLPILYIFFITLLWQRKIYKKYKQNPKKKILPIIADFLVLQIFLLAYMALNLVLYIFHIFSSSIFYALIHGVPIAYLYDNLFIILVFIWPYFIQKKNSFRIYPIIIFIFFTFLLYDLYFSVMLTNLRFITLLEIPEIWPYIPFIQKGILLVIPIGLIFSILINKKRNLLHVLFIFILWILTWLGLSLLVYTSPIHIFQTDNRSQTKIFGRMYNLFFQEASIRDLKQYQNTNLIKKLSFYIPNDILAKHLNNKNVYIIIQESYFNPDHLINTLKEARYIQNNQPVKTFGDKNLNTEYYGKKESITLSPSMAGRSVEAQFEIYCQTPAFALFGVNENKLYNRTQTYCIPHILADNGYTSILIDAYAHTTMYSFQQSLGFNTLIEVNRTILGKQQIPFQNKNHILEYPVDKSGVFDGTVFEKITQYLLPILYKNHQPFIFGIQTISSHYPVYRDKTLRPDQFKLLKSSSSITVRFLNSYHYRTPPLYKFLKSIRKKDPNAIIVVVGDHILGGINYITGGYLNDIYPTLDFEVKWHMTSGAILISNNKIHTLKAVPDYQISRWIMNELTNGWYCTQISCNFTPHLKHLNTYYTKSDIQDYKIITGIGSIQSKIKK